MRSNKLSYLLLFSLIAFSITACNNDDEQPAPDNKEMVNFEFNYAVDGASYDTSTVYTINGTAVKFSIANFYVGGITLMSEEGIATEVEDKYLLVTPTSGVQEVAELEKGHYHMARFFIGVDPLTNSQTTEDFTSRSENPNDPLGLQFPQMHWSWNNGYKFIRIDGKVDTDADGIPDETLSFHLGNDEMLKTFEFVTHKDVEEGKGHMLFEFDLAKAFDGIDLAQDHFTHVLSTEEMPLGIKFRENLGNAFTYKHP